MEVLHINLSSVARVKDFVEAIAPFSTEMDLASGRYVVDAKSIMGIFSLDLMSQLEMRIHGDLTPDLRSALEPYLTK